MAGTLPFIAGISAIPGLIVGAIAGLLFAITGITDSIPLLRQFVESQFITALSVFGIGVFIFATLASFVERRGFVVSMMAWSAYGGTIIVVAIVFGIGVYSLVKVSLACSIIGAVISITIGMFRMAREMRDAP